MTPPPPSTPYHDPTQAPVRFEYRDATYTWHPTAQRLTVLPAHHSIHPALQEGILRAQQLHAGTHIPSIDIVRRWAAVLDGSVLNIRLADPTTTFPAPAPGTQA